MAAKPDPDALEPPMEFWHPEHGTLINIDGVIAILRDGTDPRCREGYRRYLKQKRRLKKAGMTGKALRQEALLAAMRADGHDPTPIPVRFNVH